MQLKIIECHTDAMNLKQTKPSWKMDQQFLDIEWLLLGTIIFTRS